MALLAFFGMWETTVLVGAAAASVPILIHLVNRRRYRVIVWAAMRFLLMAEKQNSRKIRLEQLLLLLCRIGLVLCILLAMASVTFWAEDIWAYLWPDAAGVTKVRTARVHHILVLDASLSMNQGNDDSAFDRARQLAIRKIKDAPAGDGFSILLMKEHPIWIIGDNAPSQDRGKAARELADLTATHTNASVPEILNKLAAKLADNQKRYPGQTVYFFTDMQKATWDIPSSDRQEASADKSKAKKTDTKVVRDGNDVLANIGALAKIVFVDVGKADQSNHAVSDLRIDEPFVITGKPVKIKAIVQNFGPQRKDKLKVELKVGRAREEMGDPTLAANMKRIGSPMYTPVAANGGSAPVDFKYEFPRAGTYAVQVSVDDDGLNADNVRSLVITVKDKISVLLVNGNSPKNRVDRSTFYLQLALDPFLPNPEKRPFQSGPNISATVKEADDLSRMQDKELLGYDAVFLCDVAMGDHETTQMKKFLHQGGGVVVAAGPETWKSKTEYNSFMFDNGKGLLPGAFGDARDGQFLFDMSQEDYKERPLQLFQDQKDRTTLSKVRFQKYLEMRPSSRSRTIMYFQRADGDAAKNVRHPALVEYEPPLPRLKPKDPRSKDARLEQSAAQTYRGKVFVFTSTLNIEWGSWAGSSSFLPMMQEWVRLAVANKLRFNSHTVGQVLEEYIPSDGREGFVELTTVRSRSQGADAEASKPRRIRTQAQGEGVSVFRWLDTDRSGIYVMLNENDFHERLFAVNCPSGTTERNDSESDLTRIEPSRLKVVFPGWDLQVVGDPRLAHVPPPEPRGDSEDYVEQLSPVGPDVAHYLLLAALALLLLEVVLAWRFGRHTKVDGSTSPPASGLAWPVSLGVVFGTILVLLMFVCIHASRTGDFMSFLSNDLRLSIEKYLGVPPPPTGEKPFWGLESRADLFGLGNDFWPALGLALAGSCLIFFVYYMDGPLVSPAYKALLAGLREFIFLFVLLILLFQWRVTFDRQSPPDVVLLIDDSLSMGQPDSFTDERVKERALKLREIVRKNIKEQLPARMAALESELAALDADFHKTDDPWQKDFLKSRIKQRENRKHAWEKLKDEIGSISWAPSRLQLVQALLAQPDLDWIDNLVKRGNKVHIYHLDAEGRAIKLEKAPGIAVGEIAEGDAQQLRIAQKAVAELEAEQNDSRLGTALHQVIDHFRGGSATIIMFTDGITTRDETIKEVAEYAGGKGVPLYFVGIGDDFEVRDLSLDELKVEDVVRVNDILNFQAKLGGNGLKNMSVPVILKVIDDDGKEIELARKIVRVDDHGQKVPFTLQHQPKKTGKKTFIVELETPKSDKAPVGNRRLERTIDIQENKLIRVLLVDGTARYDFRFLKSLLEREEIDKSKKSSIELKVVLLDADDQFQDKITLKDFPGTPEELNKFDVVVFGDCDPNHRLLGKQRLKNLVDFVAGSGNGVNRAGGGILFVAGTDHNPHSYKDTPLEKLLPIIPQKRPPEEDSYLQPFRLEWTPGGRQYPMFKFTADEFESKTIWDHKLAPLFWWSKGYKVAPGPSVEVLAVHQKEKDVNNPQKGHPLIVRQNYGSGRTMFLGTDESWRWRFREDEVRYNAFWIQTIRYLSRLRSTHTDLRLNKQTPYAQGDKPEVIVTFPDGKTAAGQEGASDQNIKITVEFTPKGKNQPEPIKDFPIPRPAGGAGRFEGITPWPLTLPGRYRYKLDHPDVSKSQPKPYADAIVERPPGELEVLRLNKKEMTEAARITKGAFCTLDEADKLLENLAPERVSLSNPWPPVLLWSVWASFVLVLGLLTSEWILRKRKHLL